MTGKKQSPNFPIPLTLFMKSVGGIIGRGVKNNSKRNCTNFFMKSVA